jgi:hypothetical protein
MTRQKTPLERRDVAADADASSATPFERMLVPVDFSSASREAFALAMRLAQRWGSEVVLLFPSGRAGRRARAQEDTKTGSKEQACF